MYKYVLLCLTLALLSIVAHPAVTLADNAPPPFLASGNHDESLQLVVYLNPTDRRSGQPRDLQPDACRLTFEITARDATGVSESVMDVVDINSGEHLDWVFTYSSFDEASRSHVILEFSDFTYTGPCKALVSLSWIETSTGRTLISSTIMQPSVSSYAVVDAVP